MYNDEYNEMMFNDDFSDGKAELLKDLEEGYATLELSFYKAFQEAPSDSLEEVATHLISHTIRVLKESMGDDPKDIEIRLQDIVEDFKFAYEKGIN